MLLLRLTLDCLGIVFARQWVCCPLQMWVWFTRDSLELFSDLYLCRLDSCRFILLSCMDALYLSSVLRCSGFLLWELSLHTASCLDFSSWLYSPISMFCVDIPFLMILRSGDIYCCCYSPICLSVRSSDDMMFACLQLQCSVFWILTLCSVSEAIYLKWSEPLVACALDTFSWLVSDWLDNYPRLFYLSDSWWVHCDCVWLPLKLNWCERAWL